ncbi:MAG: Phospholipase [Rhodospirillales bacterium]|nr:Phospholipase [Rhodospirillales bacterium]
MAAIDEIEHVIVLMLENRSFDCMLGKLYPAGPSYAGLTDKETNPFQRSDGIVALPVWSSSGMDPLTATTPDPDPGEVFVDMNEQLFGTGTPRSNTRPSMTGFVANFMSQPPTEQPADPMAVMHYFTPDQLPVLSTLAKAFGVCDQWHASAPCQTWPNRFFAHSGTALGHVDNTDFPIPFPAPSIFGRLSDCDRSWRVYFHDVPQSIMLSDVWCRALLHYRFFGQFLADAQCGALPSYSFIEPRYFADFTLGIPNDQHPPHNVAVGEKLIADVYNAVRSSPNWKKSLLVITYDEHGGCYDHVPPPLAVSPDGLGPSGFPFDAYGVRVPAVIVSPYMPPGSIVRSAPAGTAFGAPPYPFDHTSIIATLRKLFNLGSPLTRRDAVAPDLLGPLSLLAPSNDGPTSVSPAAPFVEPEVVRALGYKAQNFNQDALSRMAKQLPPAPPDPGVGVPAAQPLAAGRDAPVGAAGIDAVMRVKSFLGV